MRILYQNPELIHQIESVIAADASQIEIFGENYHQQHVYCVSYLSFWQRYQRLSAFWLASRRLILLLIPFANLKQYIDRQQGRPRKPYDLIFDVGAMIIAASNGPNELQKLAPTWNSDCARPCRPPEAMRATREYSGRNTEEPVPTSAAASSISGKMLATDSSGPVGE